MKYSFYYSLKVWLFSVFLAPLIYIIAESIYNPGAFISEPAIEIYILTVLFELAFSFITWLIFWMIIVIAIKYLSNKIIIKWLIFILGIILTVLTFISLSSGENPFSFHDIYWGIMLYNCLCIGIGTWLFGLSRQA